MVTDTLGEDFPGVLVSDCLASYENVPYRTHKCIAHHLKAIAEARKRPDTANTSYLDQWRLFFQTVIGYYRARPHMSAEEFAERRQHLEAWLDRLLATPRTQAGELAIQKRIGKRRGSILTCLYEPAAEPTNNRAERDLRPAVMRGRCRAGTRRKRAGAASRCCGVWRRVVGSVVTTSSPTSPVCCPSVPAPTQCQKRSSEPLSGSNREPVAADRGVVRPPR